TAAPSYSAAKAGSSCPPAATSPRWSTRQATRRPATRPPRRIRATRSSGSRPRTPNRAAGGRTCWPGSANAAARRKRRPRNLAAAVCDRWPTRRARTSSTGREAIMYENLGRSLGTDYFRIGDQLTRDERDYWRRTRDFVDDEVL